MISTQHLLPTVTQDNGGPVAQPAESLVDSGKAASDGTTTRIVTYLVCRALYRLPQLRNLKAHMQPQRQQAKPSKRMAHLNQRLL